jgi:hypothetical protein
MKLEDIDFYISCRAEREYYLSLIPLLKRIKKEKLKELEEEKYFKQLVIEKLHLNSASIKEMKIIDEAIEWWKFKVIEKRPLIREDSKAIRMICSKINKQLREKK